MKKGTETSNTGGQCSLTQTSGWQPIETAPKTEREVMDLYEDRVVLSVLIGRANEPCESGYIGGAVAECFLNEEGEWKYPNPPEMVELFGDFSEIVDATHWMPLPDLPIL